MRMALRAFNRHPKFVPFFTPHTHIHPAIHLPTRPEYQQGESEVMRIDDVNAQKLCDHHTKRCVCYESRILRPYTRDLAGD